MIEELKNRRISDIMFIELISRHLAVSIRGE